MLLLRANSIRETGKPKIAGSVLPRQLDTTILGISDSFVRPKIERKGTHLPSNEKRLLRKNAGKGAIVDVVELSTSYEQALTPPVKLISPVLEFT